MAKPDPKTVKVVNTEAFAMAMDALGQKLGLQPGTVAGAAMSVYVSKVLDLAEKEGVALAHRTLDRAVIMLTTMREATNAKAMEEAAMTMADQQNKDVHEADRKRRAMEAMAAANPTKGTS
jgi:hypothetical protein